MIRILIYTHLKCASIRPRKSKKYVPHILLRAYIIFWVGSTKILINETGNVLSVNRGKTRKSINTSTGEKINNCGSCYQSNSGLTILTTIDVSNWYASDRHSSVCRSIGFCCENHYTASMYSSSCKNRGLKATLTPGMKQLILRCVRTWLYSARQLRSSFTLEASFRRVQNFLAEEPALRYTNIQKDPS